MKPTPPTDEKELLRRLRKGDEPAFSVLFNRYWEPMINAAYRRLQSRTDAEEVVQDIFVSIYIRRASINPKSSFEAYLMTALKYKVIDVFRSRVQQSTGDAGLAYRDQHVPVRPDEQLELKELREKIYRVAARLPDKCREVFLLSRMEQLSLQEIAARMNISESTVKKHLNKALKVLHAEIDGTVVSVGIAMLIFGKFF